MSILSCCEVHHFFQNAGVISYIFLIFRPGDTWDVSATDWLKEQISGTFLYFLF